MLWGQKIHPHRFLSPEIAKRFRGFYPGNASHFTGRMQNESVGVWAILRSERSERSPERAKRVEGMFLKSRFNISLLVSKSISFLYSLCLIHFSHRLNLNNIFIADFFKNSDIKFLFCYTFNILNQRFTKHTVSCGLAP